LAWEGLYLHQIYPRYDLLKKTYCGTPSHAAVEITLGIPYNAKMADIWSLGIILYIMIAGNNPFAAGTIHQLYKRVRALDYSFPDGFSMGALILT
jgi:serine kinase